MATCATPTSCFCLLISESDNPLLSFIPASLNGDDDDPMRIESDDEDPELNTPMSRARCEKPDGFVTEGEMPTLRMSLVMHLINDDLYSRKGARVVVGSSRMAGRWVRARMRAR